MIKDRRIDLEIPIAREMPNFPRPASVPVPREDAAEADHHAFKRAMEKPESHDEQAQSDDEQAQPDQSLPKPFALLGKVEPPEAAAQPAVDAVGDLAGGLAEAAARLAVADGSAGRREVRIELKPELLPGVTVSVYEDSGRMTAAFVCADETSRERLCAMASELAQELAQSLARAALVRVSADNPASPGLFEAAAEAPAP